MKSLGKNEGAKIRVTKTGEGVRAKNSPSAFWKKEIDFIVKSNS